MKVFGHLFDYNLAVKVVYFEMVSPFKASNLELQQT
jgi:hypothetical protein